MSEQRRWKHIFLLPASQFIVPALLTYISGVVGTTFQTELFPLKQRCQKEKKKCFQRKAKEIQGCCECFSLSPDLTAVFLMSGIKDFNLTATVFFDYLLRIRVRIILYTFISHNMLGKKIIRTRCDFMCVWELLSHILNHWLST